MPQQQLEYPRWYVGVRGFIFGVAAGSIATSGLLVGGVVTSDPWWHRWIFPTILFGSAAVVTGLFELGFTIRRHRRLQRAIDDRVATS